MIFRQLTHDDLGCASYLIGDESAGVAAVVDPRFEIDEYLELSRYMGVRIEHILETHNHADHVSGHGRLAAATGATIHIHRDAAPEYEHEPFDDGWELELGGLRVRALHTPGHRPEHTSFALIDTSRSAQPWAVLTGDTLFVGDVARPDLAIDKTDGARGIFRSLTQKLLTLPDSCEVWPGHLGGSMCGGPGMDMKRSAGALVVDVRTDLQFDEAHIPGSVCIPIHNAGFGSKLAWIADHEHDIVLVGRDDEDGRHAAKLAVAIGMRRLAGFLGGGMTSWRQEQWPTEVTQRVKLEDLPERMNHDDELQILDVRDQREWDEGHIAGSVLETWHDITALPAGLDPGRPIAVICGSGQRAATGASLLRRHGAKEVLHVVDGGVPKLGRLGIRLDRADTHAAA